MAGAPKGNKNALKHGLYAKKVVMGEVVERATGDLERGEALQANEMQRSIVRGLRGLQRVMGKLVELMEHADREQFAKLANSYSLAATALFNGHRTYAYLIGGISPVEEALKELRALNLDED